MKRGYLERRTPIRRANPERKAKRYARDFGPLADYVRGLDCCACCQPGPSDPAHVRSRGAGGHAWTDEGDGNLVPFCRACHDLQHAGGWGAVLWLGTRIPADISRAAAVTCARDVGRSFIEGGGCIH